MIRTEARVNNAYGYRENRGHDANYQAGQDDGQQIPSLAKESKPEQVPGSNRPKRQALVESVSYRMQPAGHLGRYRVRYLPGRVD